MACPCLDGFLEGNSLRLSRANRVPGYITKCQIDYLKAGLDAAYEAQTCPSCGANYRLVFATDLLHLFDGFNSNTFSYNMLKGAGMTPPPISRAPGYHADQGKWYP